MPRTTPTLANSNPRFCNLRFRHGSSSRYDTGFAKDQAWVATSGKICLDFVHEHPENDYHSRSSPTWQRPASTSTESRSLASLSPGNSQDTREHVDGDAIDSLLRAAEVSEERSARLSTIVSELDLARGPSFPDADADVPARASNQGPGTPGMWLHATVKEACLMRYFIDELARWFDLCDPDRHFALVVPQRARDCSALLNAIYTASARHLCLLQEDDRTSDRLQYLKDRIPDLHIGTAVEYHSRCIAHIVAASADSNALYDENLLLSAIILRFYEELDAPFVGGDLETGLQGTQVFIEAQAQKGLQTPLQRAAFRVAARQECYISFMKQRPFRLPFHAHDRSLCPTDDFTWAHRAVLHCADVLMYCYEEIRPKNSDYDSLVDYHRGWASLRPKSFEPLFEAPSEGLEGGHFPEMWYLSDCHVTAVQHFDLSKILLAVYNPRIPRLGPASRAATDQIEEDVKEIVRRLCGIALSNKRAPPSMCTACVAIAICGDKFTNPTDQERLLDVLIYHGSQNAWPTEQIQSRLKMLWGWTKSPESSW